MTELASALWLCCLFYTGVHCARAMQTGDRGEAHLTFIGAGLTACAAALIGVVA